DNEKSTKRKANGCWRQRKIEKKGMWLGSWLVWVMVVQVWRAKQLYAAASAKELLPGASLEQIIEQLVGNSKGAFPASPSDFPPGGGLQLLEPL
ncbi:unnamed protein product, partial [Prunus brigantina]